MTVRTTRATLALAAWPLLLLFAAHDSLGAIMLVFAGPIPLLVGATALAIQHMRNAQTLMIVDADGIALPCAYDAYLASALIDSYWVERHSSKDRSWSTLSIQCRPRVPLQLGWWASLHGVRADTLGDGDIMLDGRFIDTDVAGIAWMLDAVRAPAAGPWGDRPD